MPQFHFVQSDDLGESPVYPQVYGISSFVTAVHQSRVCRVLAMLSVELAGKVSGSG